MTPAESLVAAFAQGLMRAALEASSDKQPAHDPSPPRNKTPEESAAIGMPRVPDIAPQPEEIDLFARMRDAVREGEVDLSDVAMVEDALRRQAFDRAQAEVAAIKGDGTRRVNAPDS